MSNQVKYILQIPTQYGTSEYLCVILKLHDMEKNPHYPLIPLCTGQIGTTPRKRNAFRFSRFEIMQMFPSVNLDELPFGEKIPGTALILLKA